MRAWQTGRRLSRKNICRSDAFMNKIFLPETCYIKYGGLWDGTGDAAREGGTLWVENGRIQSLDVKHTSRAPVIDLGHLFLLPALIDCHVHLFFPAQDNTPPSDRPLTLLESGVFAVRDAGSRKGTPLPGEVLVVPTHQAIFRRGHYGASLGMAVSTVGEALAAVDFLHGLGASQVKVIVSGIFSFEHYGKVGPRAFSAAELARIVEKAATLGMPVMAHASGSEAVQACIEAGVHSIEHGYFLAEESLPEMAKKNILFVPTLSPVAAQVENEALRRKLTPEQVSVINRSLERQKQVVFSALEHGVTICAGTDAGAPGVDFGPALAGEVMLLSSCGLSPRQALTAATVNAARALAIEKDFGTIEPGKKPALLAVRENPLVNLPAIRQPECLLLPAKLQRKENDLD